MAYSFTQLQDINTRTIRDLAGAQSQLETAKGAFAAIESTLTQMELNYSGWATEVETLATTNPNDAAVQALKAEKDRRVAEFNATKTEAVTLKNAVNAV